MNMDNRRNLTIDQIKRIFSKNGYRVCKGHKQAGYVLVQDTSYNAENVAGTQYETKPGDVNMCGHNFSLGALRVMAGQMEFGDEPTMYNLSRLQEVMS